MHSGGTTIAAERAERQKGEGRVEQSDRIRAKADWGQIGNKENGDRSQSDSRAGTEAWADRHHGEVQSGRAIE